MNTQVLNRLLFRDTYTNLLAKRPLPRAAMPIKRGKSKKKSKSKPKISVLLNSITTIKSKKKIVLEKVNHVHAVALLLEFNIFWAKVFYLLPMSGPEYRACFLKYQKMSVGRRSEFKRSTSRRQLKTIDAQMLEVRAMLTSS